MGAPIIRSLGYDCLVFAVPHNTALAARIACLCMALDTDVCVMACAQLAAAEQRCILVETEVREDVSDEMADLLRSMEASYRVFRG